MLTHEFGAYAQIINLRPDSPELQGRSAVSALHDLIEAVRGGLDADHKHFLKARTDDQIADHFARGNPVFAAVHEGQLVACLMMTDLSATADRAFFAEHYQEDNLTPGNWAVHTVGVHPDHTGHRLMAALLGAMQAHAAEDPQRFQTLIAKVADDNPASRANFAAGGYSEIRHGHDRKGYDYTLFAVNPAQELAEGFGMPFNGGHDVSRTRPTAFGS